MIFKVIPEEKQQLKWRKKIMQIINNYKENFVNHSFIKNKVVFLQQLYAKYLS